jgi:hypothetical protein
MKSASFPLSNAANIPAPSSSPPAVGEVAAEPADSAAVVTARETGVATVFGVRRGVAVGVVAVAGIRRGTDRRRTRHRIR